jgi:undecaprenyl diphosphate synthase
MQCVINHLAIIPDGNRRYGRKNKLTQKESYNVGNEKIKLAIDFCEEKKIKYLSLFLLGIDNLIGRCDEELEIIFSLVENEIDHILNTDKHYYARFIISNQQMIPDYLLAKMKKACNQQKKYENQLCVNFYIGYGAHESLIKTINDVIVNKNDVSIENIMKKMNSNIINDDVDIPLVDILIRTSGEKRLSNFLLCELKYAEIFFIEKYWPEINIIDMENITEAFLSIERRFGK